MVKDTGRGGAKPPTKGQAAEPSAPKKRTPPLQFLREVRAEGRKVTWTNRKETWITSVMVFIMVGIMVVFFWVVDLGLGALIQLILQAAR